MFPATGRVAGSGRWVVSNNELYASNYGAAYFIAEERPLMFMGYPGATEIMQWSSGTTHVLIGKNVLQGYSFDSDPEYPLTFKLTDKGYVYLCGRGTVAKKDGTLLRLGYRDSMDSWLPKLKADDPLKTEAAAQALGYLAKTEADRKRVIPELITALEGKEWRLQWNAAEALGRLGDASTLAPLQSLAARQAGSQIGSLAEQSMRLIAVRLASGRLSKGDKTAISDLIEHLRQYRFRPVRLEAALSIARGIPRGTDSLITVIAAEPNLAMSASDEIAEAVASIGGHNAIDRALRHPQVQVRKVGVLAAGMAIEKEGCSPELAELLRTGATDPNWEVRDSAVMTIGRLKTRPLEEDVLKALRDPTGAVRSSAVWALGELRSVAAVPQLVVLLDGDDSYLRKLAVPALVKIGDSRALGPLERLAKRETDSDARDTIEAAVRWFRARTAKKE